MKLSIIIPTLNERDNIEPLISALEEALKGIDWEVIFVDDNSSDKTADLVEAISRNDPRVRCLKRPLRRGLSSACIEGIAESDGTFIAVMDADLQHNPIALNGMLDIFKTQDVDMVIGSRYVPGGGVYGWSKLRLALSYAATFWAQMVLGHHVKDPLSGFFMLKRTFFDANKDKLSSTGSKILMDLLMSSKRSVRFKEVPICFKPRFKGLSKHNWSLVWQNYRVAIRKR